MGLRMLELKICSENKVKDITRIKIFIELIVLKFLYMISVKLMLPELYAIWSFDKNVDFYYSLFELIPYVLCLFTYLHFYRRNSAYCFFLTLLFVIFYIPANSGLSLSKNDVTYYCLINLYSLLIFTIVGLISKKEKNDESIDRFDVTHIYDSKRRVRVIRTMLVIVCVISIGFVYLYNGLDFSKVFSDMYSTRGDYAAYVTENTDSLLSYFLLLFAKMTQWLLPLGLYFAIVNKKPVDVFLCLFSFLALFTVSMEKSTLMIIGVVIFICWEEKRKDFDRLSEILIRVFLIFFAIIFVEYAIKRESILFTLIVRRIFYMPTYLTKLYYDFFRENPKMWFTQDAFFIQNVLQRFFSRPYPTNATGVISRYYFDGLIPSPNTGLFAEAYGQMGIIGVFVFPFIVALIVRVMRRGTDWYGKGAVSVVMTRLCLQMVSVFTLPSSAFVGVLMVLGVTFLLKNCYYSQGRDIIHNGERV